MKNIYKFLIAIVIFGFAATDLLQAQQEVTIRDLNTYAQVPASQADLPDHPMVGEEVVFDAVIIGYPRNSGLASITDAGEPGRIHIWVIDVNAVDQGREGMSMHIVDPGATRDQIETLFPGEVIRVTGEHTFFGNTVQFDPTAVEVLGSINDAEYENLAQLLNPTSIPLTDLNLPSEQEGQHKWNAENYSNYINRYVKFEGLEVLDREIDNTGRPNLVLTDGTTIIYMYDTSLRYRNDRDNYAYDPETGEGLGYNWRRLADDLDGPFVPPAPGSIVDISGFITVQTFDPLGLNETGVQSTLKIVPWDDGVVWVNDGTNPADRTEPEGWANDLVVKGFAPILTEFSVTPGEDQKVFNDTQVSLSIDVLLPEDDYTLESVVIEHKTIPFTDDDAVLVTENMNAAGGNTYDFTFAAQDNFTRVEYTIVATAQTPEGVQTFGRQRGSFEVESASQASPVVFSPGAGTYVNQVSVSLSTTTEDATIFFTQDGSDPDETSTEYTGAIDILETTNLRAIVVADGLDDSPINSRTYDIDLDLVEVTSLAVLRSSPQDATTYLYTGEAVVTYNRPSANRNQRYLMDDSGGILIDDPDGKITSTYNIGDVITNLRGNLTSFSGVVQYVPLLDPGTPTGTADIVPLQMTLADIIVAEHESMLIQVDNAMFETDQTEFVASRNYNLVDNSLGDDESVTFRTNFAESNYIGQEIPTEEFNLTAIVGSFNGNLQLIARTDADFGGAVSNEDSTNPYQFSLAQNYPNPFNPSTRINYELAETTDVRLVVYDILGRRVATLINEVQQSGFHTINFDMSRYASGTYIYRLEAGDFVSVKKMMLIK